MSKTRKIKVAIRCKKRVKRAENDEKGEKRAKKYLCYLLIFIAVKNKLKKDWKIFGR